MENSSDREQNEEAEEHEEFHDCVSELQSLSNPSKPVTKAESLALKASGNQKFGEGDFEGAIDDYTAALNIDPQDDDDTKHKSLLLSNRAASYLKLQIKENYETAIEDCAKALEYDADNIKALHRRAKLYELIDNLDQALVDYQALAERDRRIPGVMEACMRLPPQIEERNEKNEDGNVSQAEGSGKFGS